MLFRLLLALFVLSLSACSSLKPATLAADPEALQSWQVEGSFELKDGDNRRVKAFFNWTQNAEQYVLEIRPDGPRGEVKARLQGQPGKLVVDSKATGHLESASPNALASRVLGGTFPIEELGYWLRGLQATAEAKTQSDSHGSLTRLSDKGWEVRISDFMQIEAYRLPEELELRKAEARLEISVVRGETAFVGSCCQAAEVQAASASPEAPAEPAVEPGATPASAVDGGRWTLNMDYAARENFRTKPPVPAWINEQDFTRQLIKVHGKVPDPRVGLFGPDSIMWRISKYIAPGGLGAGRALLLQVAHPWVARGINEHSTVRQDPVERGRKTFKYITMMIYGSLPQAMLAAHDVRGIHSSIKGKMPYEAGVFAQGSEYRASEVNAMIWVHATLWDTLVRQYELVEGKLTDDEKERFYQETKLFAMLFGIPESALPKNWQAFMEYNRSMWESGQLAVTPQTQELAHYLFHPSIWLAPVMWVQKVFTVEALPEPVRKQYGLEYGTWTQLNFKGLLLAARITDRMLPKAIRYNAVYHEAQARLKGERASWFQRRVIKTVFRQERLVN